MIQLFFRKLFALPLKKGENTRKALIDKLILHRTNVIDSDPLLQDTVGQYIASVTHIPRVDSYFPEDEEKTGLCSCTASIKPVLQRIFDFSLLSSATFIILALSGFLALLSLFVPFNFLPSE